MEPMDTLPNLCFSPKHIKNLVGRLCVIVQKGHVTSWRPRAKVDDFAPITVNMRKHTACAVNCSWLTNTLASILSLP